MNYIFDFDGTIVDSMESFIAVFNKNIRGIDNPLSPEEIERFRKKSTHRVLDTMGVRWWQYPKLVIKGLSDLRALLPSSQVFPELAGVLKGLHDRGDKLFIVTTRTNTEAGIREFLQKYDLENYFIAIDAGGGIFSKARHIQKIISANHLKRRETVYVGDETRDIQAARLVSVKVASVSWGFNTRKILKKWRPNFLIDKPADLLDIKL